jgi:uncharacterized membrane protein
MNLAGLYHDYTGLIHVVAALFAMFFGTLVLSLRKGTRRHKAFGYAYSICMLIMLVTSFMIYQLFGTWGIFHWSATVSSIVLICGLFPMFSKWPRNSYLAVHFSFMYWSVIGLYSAFVSETLVRIPDVVIENDIPNEVFYKMTGLGVAIVVGIGSIYFIKNLKRWLLVLSPII